MSSLAAAFIFTPDLEKYPYPSSSPFDAGRAKATHEILNSLGLLRGDGIFEERGRNVLRLELKKFHTARYLHVLRSVSAGKANTEAISMGLGSEDTPVFRGVYEHSVTACGATLKGVDAICDKTADIAFNPSGGFHHAGPAKAGGFSYINDAALACEIFSENRMRVFYFDTDVHHGNAVQDAFYGRSEVMTVSFHETGRALFPGTGFCDEIGTQKGIGYCVNVPLPVGTYDAAYMEVFESIAIPLLGGYDPDVIVWNLGADTLSDDPLGHLQLTNNVHWQMVNCLLGLGKPILLLGSGGYNSVSTARCWARVWHAIYEKVSGKNASQRSDGTAHLKDDEIPVSSQQKLSVRPAIKESVKAIKETVFPRHGL